MTAICIFRKPRQPLIWFRFFTSFKVSLATLFDLLNISLFTRFYLFNGTYINLT